MSKIQEQFEKDNTNYFKLQPGEYEGPLVITRPCVLDGSMSTLWANKGPVLIVDSEKVTIKNLRVELTTKFEGNELPISIKTNHNDTILSEVEVNANISGFSDNEAKWNLPLIIPLGNFAADKPNTYSYEIDASGEAEIINKIKDIEIIPKKVIAGKNQILIKTNALRNNTILYGEILVKSKVTRRIYVTGRADKEAAEHNDSSVIINSCETHTFPQAEIPNEIVAPNVSESNIEYLKRGQRVSIDKYKNDIIKIVYEHSETKQVLDVDSYIFMLSSSGKVTTDNDLIFFGNDTSDDKSVKLTTFDSKQIIVVSLDKINNAVDKVSICCSLYEDDNKYDFSMVINPVIRIFVGEKEFYRYKLTELNQERTVVGIELYRYKNEWKMAVVGAGYKNGLKQLCETFGVNVD